MRSYVSSDQRFHRCRSRPRAPIAGPITMSPGPGFMRISTDGGTTWTGIVELDITWEPTVQPPAPPGPDRWRIAWVDRETGAEGVDPGLFTRAEADDWIPHLARLDPSRIYWPVPAREDDGDG